MNYGWERISDTLERCLPKLTRAQYTIHDVPAPPPLYGTLAQFAVRQAAPPMSQLLEWRKKYGGLRYMEYSYGLDLRAIIYRVLPVSELDFIAANTFATHELAEAIILWHFPKDYGDGELEAIISHILRESGLNDEQSARAIYEQRALELGKQDADSMVKRLQALIMHAFPSYRVEDLEQLTLRQLFTLTYQAIPILRATGADPEILNAYMAEGIKGIEKYDEQNKKHKPTIQAPPPPQLA